MSNVFFGLRSGSASGDEHALSGMFAVQCADKFWTSGLSTGLSSEGFDNWRDSDVIAGARARVPDAMRLGSERDGAGR
jgi:hypothetical protein